MVDPDNEERLLKIPPRVVGEIRADALKAAREAVAAVNAKHRPDDSGNARCECFSCLLLEEALAAIDALLKEKS